MKPSDNRGRLVWRDQFKTSVLAQAAIPRLRDLVATDTTPITNDNTDVHAKVTSVNSTSATATQAVADRNTSPSRSGGTNKHARAFPRKAGTGANRGNGEGNENLFSLCLLLFKIGPGRVVELDFDKGISDGVPPCGIYAQRDGDADFVFLARRPGLSTINFQPSTIQNLREHKAVCVQSDAEIGFLSDEVVVNCAPLV